MLNISNLIPYIYKALGGDSGLPFLTIIFILLVTLFMSLYIFTIYKYAHRSSFYCKNTNIMIASVCTIVCFITISVQTSYLTFAGIIGSLSMIRLRTSLKNPLDILYIFWSLSCGLLCGANQIRYAVFICLFFTFILLIINAVFLLRNKFVLTLKIPTKDFEYETIMTLLNKYGKNIVLKHKYEKNYFTKLTFSLKTKQSQKLLSDLSNLPFTSICLLEFDGDFRH